MQPKGRFDHYNFNVVNLEKSLTFYEAALGLKEKRRRNAEDGSYIIVYLGDGATEFSLELTWLRDWDRPYELGDNEVHLCMRMEGNYDDMRAFHKKMGCVVYENPKMNLYFIADPDNHWIEILPIAK